MSTISQTASKGETLVSVHGIAPYKLIFLCSVDKEPTTVWAVWYSDAPIHGVGTNTIVCAPVPSYSKSCFLPDPGGHVEAWCVTAVPINHELPT